MDNPYTQQPPRAFWRRTITPHHPLDIPDWYHKRFDIDGLAIATAGSCFAQHIGRNLRAFGFNYLDTEPAPDLLPGADHLDFGYGMYSARYGNIYSARQWLQLLQRAQRRFAPAETHWEKDGGVVDPFRPTIEPAPFSSVAELTVLRDHHLDCVLQLFETADVFVFTMGLTEIWESRIDGAVYPLCPGTAGGRYDDSQHRFRNQTSAEVRADMEAVMALARDLNPDLRFLLTVSPVPLVATATAQQVAVASTYSKSVLRAVAGELYQEHDFVDYFPSYEIVTAPVMGGTFFQPNRREVSHHGVDHVMGVFFSQHPPPPQAGATSTSQPPPPPSEAERQDQVLCDEELLNSFGRD